MEVVDERAHLTINASGTGRKCLGLPSSFKPSANLNRLVWPCIET